MPECFIYGCICEINIILINYRYGTSSPSTSDSSQSKSSTTAPKIKTEPPSTSPPPPSPASQQSTSARASPAAETKSAKKAEKAAVAPTFENSVAALEKHLKTMHEQRIAAAASIKAEQNKRIKLEQKESAQQSESGEVFVLNPSIQKLIFYPSLFRILFDCQCNGSIPESEEEFELTEWFPPDLDLGHFEKVVVTDVTVDDVTVTMRESESAEGFFDGCRRVTNSAA